MAGHQRPLFVLFGASLTENAFHPGGWGASLADYYTRKADVLVRGYTGWNTRRAVAVLEKFFPKDHPSQPALVVVFFGSNDAAFPLPSGMGQSVPITEYKANLRQICAHIKGLSDTSRVVLVTPSPVFDEARRAYARRKWGSLAGNYPDRTNQRAQEYAEACIEVAKEMDVGVVDLWNAIQRTKVGDRMSEVNSFQFPPQADVENRQTDKKFADTSSESISISIANSLKMILSGPCVSPFFEINSQDNAYIK